jgi:hypothetical protein
LVLCLQQISEPKGRKLMRLGPAMGCDGIAYPCTVQELLAFFAKYAVSVSELACFLGRHTEFFGPDRHGGRRLVMLSFLDNHDGDRYTVGDACLLQLFVRRLKFALALAQYKMYT